MIKWNLKSRVEYADSIQEFFWAHTHTHSLFAELRISYNQNTAPQVSSALSFRALIMLQRPPTSQNSAKVLNHMAALSVFFAISTHKDCLVLPLAYGSSALLSFAEVPPFPQFCGFLCDRVTFAWKADHLLTFVLLVAEGGGGGSCGGHDAVDSGHKHDLVVCGGGNGSVVDDDHDMQYMYIYIHKKIYIYIFGI